MTPSPDPLITLVDVSGRLNVSLRSVQRLVRQGRIRVIRIGRLVRVQAADVDRFIRNSIKYIFVLVATISMYWQLLS